MVKNHGGNEYHFLLVEDDDSHALMVEIAFEADDEHDASLTRVETGLQALNYLRQSSGYEDSPRPGVVLRDLKLPGLDGFDVLQEIKADPELKSIPVVLLSTSDAAADRHRAHELHANGYITKPIGFDAFCEMIRDTKRFWARNYTQPPAQRKLRTVAEN